MPLDLIKKKKITLDDLILYYNKFFTAGSKLNTNFAYIKDNLENFWYINDESIKERKRNERSDNAIPE